MSLTGIGEIADAVSSIVGKFFPDKTEEEKAKIAMVIQMVRSQTETNRVEAASPSVFVAGWRPAVGWTCALAFCVQFVIGPLGTWLAGLSGHPVQFPNMDLGTMMPLLLGMLGLGGMRTFEKVSGVNNVGH